MHAGIAEGGELSGCCSTEQEIILYGGGTPPEVDHQAGAPATLLVVNVTLSGTPDGVVGTILTAQDGRYELTNLSKGSYTLAASAAGYRPITPAVSSPG